jgi:hypothetical protein
MGALGDQVKSPRFERPERGVGLSTGARLAPGFAYTAALTLEDPPTMTTRFDVTAIGNAIVDVIATA